MFIYLANLYIHVSWGISSTVLNDWNIEIYKILAQPLTHREVNRQQKLTVVNVIMGEIQDAVDAQKTHVLLDKAGVARVQVSINWENILREDGISRLKPNRMSRFQIDEAANRRQTDKMSHGDRLHAKSWKDGRWEESKRALENRKSYHTGASSELEKSDSRTKKRRIQIRNELSFYPRSIGESWIYFWRVIDIIILEY